MKISDCWNCGYLCYVKGRYYCLWYKTHPKAMKWGRLVPIYRIKECRKDKNDE